VLLGRFPLRGTIRSADDEEKRASRWRSPRHRANSSPWWGSTRGSMRALDRPAPSTFPGTARPRPASLFWIDRRARLGVRFSLPPRFLSSGAPTRTGRLPLTCR